VDNEETPSPARGAGRDSHSPSIGEGRGGSAPEQAPPPRCPFCDSRDAQVISLFGTQVMTMQVRCRACGSYYEASKY